MNRLLLVSLSSCACLAVAQSNVQAAERGTSVVPGGDAHHRISMQLGVAAPLGLLGLGWAYAPTLAWRLEGGVGAGLSGMQTSMMLGRSVGSGPNRFVFGAGPALALNGPDPLRIATVWLNVEAAGWEHVSPSGSTFFLGVGVSLPLSDVRIGQGHGSFEISRFTPVPQLRLGFGSWIGDRPSPTKSEQQMGVEPPRRRHRLSLQVGAGDPAAVGPLAGAWAYEPWKLFRVEASFDWHGGSMNNNWYPSFMSSFVLGHRHRFTAGVGLAWQSGESRVCNDGCMMLALEPVGYECVFDGGLSLFVAAGATVPDRAKTNQDFPEERLVIWSGYMRLGIGWWL